MKKEERAQFSHTIGKRYHPAQRKWVTGLMSLLLVVFLSGCAHHLCEYTPPTGSACNPQFGPSSVSQNTWDQNSPVQCNATTARLFSDADPNDVFEFELQANFDIINDPNISVGNADQAQSPGTLRYVDAATNQTVEIPITLEARGHSRFTYCAFRPLKIVFAQHQVGNIFEGASKKVKIATHCGNHPTNPWILGGTPEEQRRRLLAEYYFYQMLETSDSTALSTRLARITYRDHDGSEIITEYAFLREREDDTCKRCGFIDEADSGAGLTPDPLSAFQGELYNKFVYNNDYNITSGHNTRICYDSAATAFYIPYDWDLTGVIRPDYFKNNNIPYTDNANTLWSWLMSQSDQARTKVQAWHIVSNDAEMREIIENTILDQTGKDLMKGWYNLYICVFKCYVGLKCGVCDPNSLRSSADFNGDGFSDLAIGVQQENIGDLANAGAVNVLYGARDGLSATGNQVWQQGTPGVGGTAEAGDHFGAALANGDFNNDGFADLAIGVPQEAITDLDDAGAVNVLYGSSNALSSSGSQVWHQNTAGIGGTSEAGDHFGSALAAGDFNNDGFADLAIGVPQEAITDRDDAGAVNVLYGSSSGVRANGNQVWNQDSDGIGGSSEAGDYFGSALAAGDFNNDGFADLSIGVPQEAITDRDDAGAVNVLYGSSSGLRASGNQVWHQDSDGIGGSSEAGDHFGSALAAGDFNNDGFADLAIGVRREAITDLDDAGAVNVLYGSSSGLRASGNQVWHQDSDGIGGSSEAGDHFGSTLAAGDFNNDGFVDLAIGVQYEAIDKRTGAGAVNILYGSSSGLVAANSQIWHQDTSDIGGTAEAGDEFGSALVSGDFNNDGFADLAIGTGREAIGDHDDAGAVNVLYGSDAGLTASGNQVWHQDSSGIGGTAEPGDRFGSSL